MINSKRSLSALGAYLRAKLGDSSTGAKARESSASSLSRATTSGSIPIVHQLAIIYLMLPVAIWLVGWFEWWFGIPAVALMALGLWPALAPSRLGINWQGLSSAIRSAICPSTIVLLLIAFAWVMTTASGGIFDLGNTDWIMQRRVLLALSSGDWPAELLPNLRSYLGTPIMLRHNLAHYLVPGLLGRLLGVEALNWAVPFWTWCGVGLIFVMFTRGLFGWKVIVAAAILIFFSGMDIVRIAMLEGLDWIEFDLVLDGWPRIELGREHLEWGGLYGARIQFSSHMVGLMWVPKHFVAAALYALLLLQIGQKKRFLAASGILLAAAPFWSPFVAIGLLPFVLVLFIQNGMSPFLRWQNLLLSLPLVALLFVYLSSGTADINRGWVWDVQLSSLRELVLLPIVCLTEFLVLAMLLFILQPRLRTNLLFIASMATLVLLPLYSYGSFNDLVMRGAMPAFFLLCYYSAHAVVGASRQAERRWSIRNCTLIGLLTGVLVIGAVTPLFELARANNNHDFRAFHYEFRDLRSSYLGVVADLPSTDKFVHHYASIEIPNWLLQLLALEAIDRTSAESDLLLQSEFDVYLDDRTLVFIREPCSQDERLNLFFVQVTPLNLRDLPEGRTHFTYDFVMQPWNSFKIGDACVAVQELRDPHAIGRVTVGQLNAERSNHSWVSHYFSPAYRNRLLAEAVEPIINSDFDVYLHREETGLGAGGRNRRSLLYFKPECSQNDMEARMLLHVVPVTSDDLAEKRREEGHDVLDFHFHEFGGRSDGSCFAARDLPEYAILEIRVGREFEGGGRIWVDQILLEELEA